MEPRLLSIFFIIVFLAAGKHKIKIHSISLTDIVRGFINQHVIILALGMSFLCFFLKFAHFTVYELPELACCLCLQSARQPFTLLHSRNSLCLLGLVPDIQMLERLEFSVANSKIYSLLFLYDTVINCTYVRCRNDVFILVYSLQS